MVGKTDAELFDETTAARLTEIKSRVLADGQGQHAEIAISGGGAETRFVEFRAEPLRDYRGNIVGITGVKMDITERKRAEQHRAFLLAELDHRVKNNLSVVLALAEESVRSSTSMEQFSQAFIGRVRALAKTHAALAAARWQGVRLRNLVDLILETYTIGAAAGVPARASIAGEAVQLSPKAASALCMTLNELLTNAVKYGAFSTPEGRVSVTWNITPMPAGPPLLRILWTETGGPLVRPPARRGLGSQLIEDGIAYELAGMVRTDYHPLGVVCTIEVPLNLQNTSRGRFEPSTSVNQSKDAP
jgi:two-component sensor histidine kinase